MKKGILRVEALTKSFGGLMAVDHVAFEIDEGELSSIIGPNGAGKTTLFNLLTGNLNPNAGEIFFKEKEISGISPDKICRKGIGRSFQITNIFPRLSVFDNVQVAMMAWQRKSAKLFAFAKNLLRRESIEILASIGLADKAEVIAGLLAHGDQRLLDFGIALASHPELLLLDEPTAGMSPDESARTMELIKKLVQDRRLTLLFIEHDMNVVFGISEKIRVMHLGRIIAEGSPEEVRSRKEVQRIYLGEER
jgi:branched-chain amino acid transport system ATP-binding protein